MRTFTGSKNLGPNDGAGGGVQPQAMGVNPQGMMVVPTTTDSSGSEQAIQTPAWHAANAARQEAAKQEIAAVQAEGQQAIDLSRQQIPGAVAEGERRAAENSAHLARLATIQKDIDNGIVEYKRRAAAAMEQPGGFWDDKTDGQKSQIRLGIWLSAIGGGLTGQDSKAMGFLEKAIERDAKTKQQRAERLFRQAEMAKGAYKDALESRAHELADYEANVKAGWDTMIKDAETLAKIAGPGIQQEQLNAKVAQLTQKSADADMKAQQEIARKVHSSHSVVTPTNMSGTGAQRETVNELVEAQAQSESLKELEKIVKRNPEAWVAYRDAAKSEGESNAAVEAGGISGNVIKFARGQGWAPLSIDERLVKHDDPQVVLDAKRINQLWPIIQTGQARVFDPVGVLNEGSHVQAKKHLNLFTMEPGELLSASQMFRAKAEKKADILGSDPKMQARLRASQSGRSQPAAPRAPAATVGDAVQLKRDLIDAHKALLDPKADAQMKAAARRFIADHGGK